MEESSFPVISSVAELPKVTCRSNALAMTMMDTSNEDNKLYIVSTEGHNCHVITYSMNQSSAIVKATISFHQDLQTAECYRQEGVNHVIVVTRDGRLWYGSLKELTNGTFSYNEVCCEYNLEQPLLPKVKLLSVCKHKCKGGPAVAIISDEGSEAPPHVLWLDQRRSERIVPGLEHVHSPITSTLLLSREMVTPAFWSVLTRVPACGDGESAENLLLGFANGAIRSCLITESKTLLPVHLLARLDHIEQQVLSILEFTGENTRLIDSIYFVGSKGAVSLLDASASLFRHVSGGLRWKGPWISAAAIEFNGKRGIVAIRHDGTSHLLALRNEASEIDSACIRLPFRGGMTTVATCASPPGSWLATGTTEGSLLLLNMDSNDWDSLLAWSDDDAISATGIRNATGEGSHTVSTTKSRAHDLVQRLHRFQLMDQSISSHDDVNLQYAMDKTKLVMKVVMSSEESNLVSNAVISEDNGMITAQGAEISEALPCLSGQGWTSSLHACTFGDDSEVVCQRFGDGNELPVYYGGVAVTETRPIVSVGEGIDEAITLKRGSSGTIDAFLSVSDSTESNGSRSKRRKTSSRPNDRTTIPIKKTLTIPL